MSERGRDFLDVESLTTPEAVERERYLVKVAADAALVELNELRAEMRAQVRARSRCDPRVEAAFDEAKARHQDLLHRLGHLRRRFAAVKRPIREREDRFPKEAAFVRAARRLLTGEQFDAIWREVDAMREGAEGATPERGSLSALPPQSGPAGFRRRREERE